MNSLAPVVLAGGGSAGHVSPLLAIADALRRRDPNIPITALGTRSGLEADLVPQRGYDIEFLPKTPMPRKISADWFKLPGQLAAAVRAARSVISETGAQAVVGMGGYVSTPAYLAARQLNVPIVIHEQNSRAGLANRLGAAMTPHVATTFPNTVLRGATCIGMPLRREITQLDRVGLRQEAAQHFGLDPQLPTVLVTGGSLGAQKLNEVTAECAPDLLAAGVQVLHVTGRGKMDWAASGMPAAYQAVEYVDRMDLAYSIADAVLCRAGANTVCELAAVGLPACYVPLPIGNGEQRLNAEPVVAAGGGMLVDNAALSRDWVLEHFLPVVSDPDRLQDMRQAAVRFGVTDADERMADLIISAMATSSATPRTRKES